MTKYREILRMSARGFSQRVIASTLSISRNTVASTLKRAREQNLDWEAVEQQRLSEKDIANLLFPDRKRKARTKFRILSTWRRNSRRQA